MAMSVGVCWCKTFGPTMNPAVSVSEVQCDFANKLVSLCVELRHEEDKCREQMDERVSKMLTSKKGRAFSTTVGRHGVP